MQEPKYLSEYLNEGEFAQEVAVKKDRKKPKLNWKLILLLLLPFGTAILIGYFIVKKLNSRKNGRIKT